MPGIRTRRLELIHRQGGKEGTMKVAFASTDKKYINEHFGQATQFQLWEIGAESAAFSGTIHVEAGEEDGDRIEARAQALSDCAIVYVTQIGGPAAARLVAKKIHPIRSQEEETIQDAVSKLQGILAGSPPPWLRKAMSKGHNEAH